MNILSLNLFTAGKQSNIPAVSNSKTSNRYGLVMAKPLLKDTVSFGSTKQSVKKMASRSDAITIDLSKKIRAKKEKPHKRKKQLLLENFSPLIEQGLVTFKDRVKGENSICEKSATRGWNTMDLVLKHMNDISGFCFELNASKAFPEIIKRFKSLLKTRELEITEAEYHRREPKYKNSKIVASYDSLDPQDLQVLKNEINKIQNPTTQIWKDVDSRSGYSGLHLTLRTKDGEKSELQIMTQSMGKTKKIENLLYKIRNGKTVDTIYEPVEKYLAPLKPLDEYASASEKQAHEALQSAMTKYTQEAYEKPLKKPFDSKFELLKVSDSGLNKKEKNLIAKYDFNKIAILIEACEKMAEK